MYNGKRIGEKIKQSLGISCLIAPEKAELVIVLKVP